MKKKFTAVNESVFLPNQEISCGSSLFINPTRACISCSKEKASVEFYSKGKRLDSSCKSCILEKKKSVYKRKKKRVQKIDRKSTKMLNVSDLKIEEKFASEKSTNIKQLEDILEQFMFRSICNFEKEGNNEEEVD